MFADPFTTAGLVIDAKMHAGFRFEVYDLYQEKRIVFDCPADMYDLLMYIGAPARYVLHSVTSKTLDEQAAATSTQRLSLIAGKYVGKDDPVMIVRCQSGLPSIGEALEPFALAYTVGGSMRGSHHAPLMPVPVAHAHPSRFDGPPRVVCLGFQITGGRLLGPRDMFDDPAFDRARAQANEVMDYLRRHGPFEPHGLGLDELEYTTMPALEDRLAGRWQPLPAGIRGDGHRGTGLRPPLSPRPLRGRQRSVASSSCNALMISQASGTCARSVTTPTSSASR